MDDGKAAHKDTVLVRDHGLAVLCIAGEDATSFLNAQCTAALADESDGAVRMAALADAKGRVLLIFHAWRSKDAWRLAVPAGETEWLCDYLARFIFRSRVRIAATPEKRLFGVTGPEAVAALTAVGLPAPEAGNYVRAGPLEVIGLTGDRALVIGEGTALADAAHALAAHATPGDAAAWRRTRLMADEVEIRAETRARFLPQMLGLVERGAVSFRKGCYPGQEVIARTQNLGRVKRALALLRLDAPLEAGSTQEVEGTRIEVLDSVTLNIDGALVQTVAPSPLPDALLASRELQSGRA